MTKSVSECIVEPFKNGFVTESCAMINWLYFGENVQVAGYSDEELEKVSFLTTQREDDLRLVCKDEFKDAVKDLFELVDFEGLKA